MTTTGLSPIVLILAVAGLSVTVVSGRPELTCTFVNNVIIGQDSIDMQTAKSATDCCDRCNANDMCVAFTFDTKSNDCYLKDNLLGNTSMSDRVSGTNGRPVNDLWYACTAPGKTSFKFCDTTLSQEDRINDLVSRISLDEAGPQLTARQAPELPDLGLPAYYSGTNAIHGLQNVECLANGVCPTSFAAPCALSATFNMSLVKDMGNILGRELRAYYNNHIHNSLDTWSPTININRDPRWGRNVESPGEDPLVCGEYGKAYTEGLQFGEDPKMLQAVVTLKHWVAYSVESFNGVTRHTYNAVVSPYDLQSTYFPGWKATIEAGARGVMCSYNELNGIPTCGNPALTAILREDWGFQGYITSDSDAVGDIYSSHHYEPNGEKAVRDAIEAGCDMDSGNTYIDHLPSSVNQSLTSFADVQSCLFRVYRMRFDTGLFDPNVTTPYRNISTTEVGSDAHKASSLLGSRQSMVLLKNDGKTLPFKTGRSIAVIGTSSNVGGDLLGNYVGPICPSPQGLSCVPSIYDKIKEYNAGGPVTLVSDATKVADAVAAAKAADLVVLVASNAKDGGGEGQDRYYIHLETVQYTLCQAVLQVGKPTVLVLVNGGIIAIDGLKDLSPAILETFMPGVFGAQAIAETIFGLNNPGGKLPVTMYNSSYINDVDFLNMSMTNGPGRSYRYFTGVPLYPFGYGLSYTTFSLSWSPQPPPLTVVRSLSELTFTVNVTNTGDVAGDEVVLAFFKPNATSIKTLGGAQTPIKQLFAFQRVNLKSGQTITLQFTVNATKFALADSDGHLSLHGGMYDVVFSRGHGAELHTPLVVETEQPIRLHTFRKWW